MHVRIITCLLLTSIVAPIRAADLYETKIKPLLRSKCAACHGALKQQAGLRLDAGRLILKGGDSGTVINVQDVNASLILKRVSSSDEDLRMPPPGEGEPLDAKQLAWLREWIRTGAKVPKSEKVPPRPQEHWAFKRPVKVPLPKSGPQHPIDAFIVAQYRKKSGLRAVSRADKATLLRRLYFDLVGLPPTRAQLTEFASDSGPKALERTVDRLLKSPLHAQRWARHWMDVWRYSDWDGYMKQVRGSQRHIWRWRDWIVESLHRDVPYDRMIVEMLAGDEIAPKDPRILRATGFLARNFHHSNRNIWLDRTVEHTAKALLGLTLNCARCHDHKYDPIRQQDFYSFRAIFEPHHVRIQQVGKIKNLQQSGLVRVYDKSPRIKTFLYLRGNEKHPDKENPIAPAVPEFFGYALSPRQIRLPKQKPIRQPVKKKGKKTKGTRLVAVPRISTGRRLALANWIASKKNPLTARVAMNHIWTRHFGRPLVDRMDDFGLRSPQPRYAQLLDWLAVEFMEHGWSMRHIHKLIVTSNTWQLASSVDSRSRSSHRVDPDNKFYWRANTRRLESEAVRDALLFVAGSLDVSTGGPDIPHAQGETVFRRSLYFQHAYEKQMKMMVLFDGPSPNECYRREESVIPQQALVMANSDLSLSQSRKLARALWKETASSRNRSGRFVTIAFKQLLSREPSKAEAEVCQEFLTLQAKRLEQPKQLSPFRGGAKPSIAAAGDPAMRARENLIHVLMNHNDFITIR